MSRFSFRSFRPNKKELLDLVAFEVADAAYAANPAEQQAALARLRHALEGLGLDSIKAAREVAIPY